MLSIYFNFCNMPMSVTMERDKNRLKLTFSILFRFASYSQKLKKKCCKNAQNYYMSRDPIKARTRAKWERDAV